jgi:hypothetical protein
MAYTGDLSDMFSEFLLWIGVSEGWLFRVQDALFSLINLPLTWWSIE